MKIKYLLPLAAAMIAAPCLAQVAPTAAPDDDAPPSTHSPEEKPAGAPDASKADTDSSPPSLPKVDTQPLPDPAIDHTNRPPYDPATDSAQ